MTLAVPAHTLPAQSPNPGPNPEPNQSPYSNPATTRARPAATEPRSHHLALALTLADLSARSGVDVFDHLERELTIPVVDGLQAQGDLLVVPLGMLAGVTVSPQARWRAVPPSGIELLRSAAGGDPHTLVADPGTCRWTTGVRDTLWLALGVFETSAVAYLIHPEHGASGIAPGTYAVRRQRERSGSSSQRIGGRLVVGADRLVAD